MPRYGERNAAHPHLPTALRTSHGYPYLMTRHIETLVVGSGPAGIAAAVRAAEQGAEVGLVDDNPTPGGQIWRGQRESFDCKDGPSSISRPPRLFAQNEAAK
jgi:NADPH-dependent 2,4-dienoyl-CoA reductase/sulfur reductase-like enzyme